jgi:CheY-like chemotaxis protein
VSKQRILIVENEGITAMDADQILRDLGHEVVGIAITGEDAFELAIQYEPDLILMDIKLAGDMSGTEAARKIREIYDIPVVYITAYGDKETSLSRKFSPPKGFGYIVKPFSAHEIKSEVERLLSPPLSRLEPLS